MAWGKSDEEKAAEEAQEKQRRAEYLQQQAEAARQKQAAEYGESPVGRAESAVSAGAAFFQVQIEVSRLDGTASFGAASGSLQHDPRADVLGQIESFGWRLENVGYVFVETGTTSTGRVLMSGEATAVRGVVLGIYLFRNANLRTS